MRRKLGIAAGAFLAFVGLVGSLLEIYNAEGSMRAAAILVVCGALIVLGIWVFAVNFWRRLRVKRALPDVKKLVDICTGYQTIQATAVEVNWIAQQEADIYPPEDAVPKHVLTEWCESNPTGFNVIKMSNGQKIGHLDILPLRPATLKAFLEGRIVEKDIRGDSLFTPAERESIRDLYVESIIVLPPKGYSNAPAILCVLTNFASLVGRICDPAQVNHIYAIAASPPGARLLKRLGFDIIRPASGRADHHDFYMAKFSELTRNIVTICGPRFPDDALSV